MIKVNTGEEERERRNSVDSCHCIWWRKVHALSSDQLLRLMVQYNLTSRKLHKPRSSARLLWDYCKITARLLQDFCKNTVRLLWEYCEITARLLKITADYCDITAKLLQISVRLLQITVSLMQYKYEIQWVYRVIKVII